MKITFLGTTSMIPTKNRGHIGVLVENAKEKILVDCGEGVQRQMRIARIAPPRITRIFLTHWHGDHVVGLPGLLENLAKQGNVKSIKMYGVEEVGKKIKKLMDVFDINKKIKVEFTVIKKDGIFESTNELEFGAYFLKHSAVTLGYYIKDKDRTCIDKKKIKKYGLTQGPILGKLKKGKDIVFKGKKIKAKDIIYVKKGKKVSLCLDSVMCNNCIELAKDSDVFVCESTYLSNMKDKAKKHLHLTSGQAGEIAKKANAKKLVLTHFSQRYNKKDLNLMKKEAKEIFGKEVVISEDFMRINA